MNVKNAKKPEKRIDTSYVSRYRMQAYGKDNLYPQTIRAITGASGTAELCLARYQKFVEGYGFQDTAFSEAIMNPRGETADDLLHAVTQDLTRHGGFALHINYNVLCQVTGVSVIPFEQCRLEECDDRGEVAHIIVHPDWTFKRTRNGKPMTSGERWIDRIAVFDPRPEVVSRQIQDAGGIEQYKGQVLWFSMAGRNTYPTPIYDAVITEISTDEGLGNIKYRNTRNNFLVSCMLVAKKGVPRIDEQGEEVEQSMITADELREFQGDENGNKILYVELENDEDEPKVIAFPSKSYDKDFTVTDQSVIERIYAQFHQELFYAIRMGKLGFSGTVMRDAYEYYAGEVTTEQRAIQRAFGKIMAAFGTGEWAQTDMTLQPLKYISSDTTTINTTDNE